MALLAFLLIGAARAYPANLDPIAIHYSSATTGDRTGWHDIAGAITHKGVHHVFQGTGWNHASSPDLVRWSAAPHGPSAIEETYAGMDSRSDPCSGFLTKDPLDGDRVCAGFRQCGSSEGVAGGQAWDVPLELRCAVDDDLSAFDDASPEYLFNVSFWRHIPYDPARPWVGGDGRWYVLLSMDGCNATDAPREGEGCALGGQLDAWSSPALRGPEADWTYVGPAFTDNTTVLPGAHLEHEFVTIDFLGFPEVDPKLRVFFDNVGGNGGGVGCCSGTTSWRVMNETAPGGPFEELATGMVDYGAFVYDGGDVHGTGSRGFSMARTLGSEAVDQVTEPGRRVMIGWTGPPPNAMNTSSRGSAQSLPRELTLSGLELLQRFVPELEALRRDPVAPVDGVFPATRQAEAVATFAAAACASGCGFDLLLDVEAGASLVRVSVAGGRVLVDATTLGNPDVRTGPLPPAVDGAYVFHAIVDHSIVELIVNNRTALVVYAAPGPANTGASVQDGGTLVVWPLEDPGHNYTAP